MFITTLWKWIYLKFLILTTSVHHLETCWFKKKHTLLFKWKNFTTDFLYRTVNAWIHFFIGCIYHLTKFLECYCSWYVGLLQIWGKKPLPHLLNSVLLSLWFWEKKWFAPVCWSPFSVSLKGMIFVNLICLQSTFLC